MSKYQRSVRYNTLQKPSLYFDCGQNTRSFQMEPTMQFILTLFFHSRFGRMVYGLYQSYFKTVSCDPHAGDHMLILRNCPQSTSFIKNYCLLRDFHDIFIFFAISLLGNCNERQWQSHPRKTQRQLNASGAISVINHKTILSL